MNLNIGVQGSTRELKLEEVELSEEQLLDLVKHSSASGEPLVLEAEKGRKVIIPAAALGYVEITSDEKRAIGFGLV
ncbi:hypothetical protein BSR29_02265 [Boudabousia liubingyangii]|uniref:DUF3107 domain-containing protein n=1 Tax=Boudabousia liubingyangii TaxID=1921764 RepID=A0A1Q5PQE2_9ACTO|nr:DUF3107 domain-containing protein [Boudabousia liubingyangii]OKL49794.1 hypothetical protein BSR29_02265 [Boudabousia liubingyangii]